MVTCHALRPAFRRALWPRRCLRRPGRKVFRREEDTIRDAVETSAMNFCRVESEARALAQLIAEAADYGGSNGNN
jgi:hypothetical protein